MVSSPGKFITSRVDSGAVEGQEGSDHCHHRIRHCKTMAVCLPTSDIWFGPRLNHSDLRQDWSLAKWSTMRVTSLNHVSLGSSLRDKEAIFKGSSQTDCRTQCSHAWIIVLLSGNIQWASVMGSALGTCTFGTSHLLSTEKDSVCPRRQYQEIKEGSRGR